MRGDNPSTQSPSRVGLTRREVLRASALAGAGVLLTGRRAFAAPSERVNVAVVGCGVRGAILADEFAKVPGVRLAAACDVDSERLAVLADKFGVEKRVGDYRDLLADPGIDAVVVAAPNHWHCKVAIEACIAGKHVYVEKPLGHDLWQQRQLVHAARRYGRVVQVGTQQRSDPMQDEIRKFLHEERGIGEVTGVVAARIGARASVGKRAEPLAPPRSVDLDRWFGPAEAKPLFRDHLHYDWHWDWNTGDGEMGNWGVHVLDDVRNVVFNDSVGLPRSVAAVGARVLWGDAAQTPNVHLTLIETGGAPVVCVVSNVAAAKDAPKPKIAGVETGYVVYGEGGRFEGIRARGVAFDSEGKKIREFQGDSGQRWHMANFVDAVRRGDSSGLNAEVEVGHLSSSWCHYGNAAYLAGGATDGRDAAERLSGSAVWRESLDSARGWMDACGVKLDGAPFVVSESIAIDQETGNLGGSVPAAAQAPLRREYRDAYAVPEIEPVAV